MRKFCATIFPKLNIDINSPVQPSYGIKKKVCVRHTLFLPKSPGLSESRGFCFMKQVLSPVCCHCSLAGYSAATHELTPKLVAMAERMASRVWMINFQR